MINILKINTRQEFRDWLTKNNKTSKECYLNVKRIKPDNISLTYLDAVEEALCFGWIDSVLKNINGVTYQRFSQRNKKSLWSELNKERARRLIKLGLMSKEGRKSLPNLGIRSYKIDQELVLILKKNRCYKTFKSFPPLYQRIRSYNVTFSKTLGKEAYNTALNHFISETKKGNMYGEWNDYGRLLDY